jgi:iron complex outermembrane receptor protein
MLRRSLPLLALLMPAAAAAQTGAVAGRVTDTGGRPLIGASVAVEGGEGRALTNDRGEYRLNLVPAGPVRLRASKVNYIASSRRVTAVAGATVSRDFRLLLPAAERDELPVR